MKNKLPSINLIKKDRGNFFDKFINWALTFGRLVVILTEGVALGAFLYRFSLDRQLIDLHDEISQKQAIVKYLKANEDKYRDTQARISVASKFNDSGQNTYRILANVVNLAPDNFTFNNLSLLSPTVRLDGNASVNVANMSIANNIELWCDNRTTKRIALKLKYDLLYNNALLNFNITNNLSHRIVLE